MRNFKFFQGVVYYSATTISGEVLWTNENMAEMERNRRRHSQREQTNRMRNFGARIRNNRTYSIYSGR